MLLKEEYERRRKLRLQQVCLYFCTLCISFNDIPNNLGKLTEKIISCKLNFKVIILYIRFLFTLWIILLFSCLFTTKCVFCLWYLLCLLDSLWHLFQNLFFPASFTVSTILIWPWTCSCLFSADVSFVWRFKPLTVFQVFSQWSCRRIKTPTANTELCSFPLDELNCYSMS